MTIKIFCDIADISLIKKFNNKSIVKGFTTNPTLMRKAEQKIINLTLNKYLKFAGINQFLLKYLPMIINL